LLNIRPLIFFSVALSTALSIDHNQSLDLENQLPHSKEEKLKEIANLVCGIRLCNMDRTNCKEEITDSK